jgi:RNA polymerase sigma-70 factor (ECF subfamily)
MAGLQAPPVVPAVSEDAVVLIEALRRLPLRHRQALVLHYLLDLPVEEAARTLEVPAGTVKSWLARGRKALAAHLGEEEVRADHG